MYNNKKILIEHGPGIGDLITLTPVIKRFKQLFPNAILSIVSNQNCLPIIERLPYIDNVYGIQKHKFLGRYYPVPHFLEQDYIIFFSWQSHLVWMSKLLNIKHRYGYCREKYLKCGLFHKYISSQNADDITNRTVFLTNELSKVLNIDLYNDGICEISEPSLQEEKESQIILNQNAHSTIGKYVIIAPFGNTARTIPLSILIQSIEYINNQLDCSCVLINDKDSLLSHKLSEININGNIINLCGKTNLMQMVALLKNAQFSLTTDSAPMHISAAVKTPCISIFSTDSSYKWAPKEFCFPIDLHVPCSPCRPEKAAQCTNQICINNITSDMIIQKILQLYDL